MKTVTLTPQSFTKSTTTTTGDQSETRETNTGYFPGCRKDANCTCDMCLASINATLDLMPYSAQRSNLSKINTISRTPISRTPISRTPISFDSSISTPKSRISPVRMVSPGSKSTARMRGNGRIEEEVEKMGFGVWLMRVFLGVWLVFGLVVGVSCVVFRVLRPELSMEMVRGLGEESLVLQHFDERVVFLKKQILGVVGVKNLNGSSFLDFQWEIIQDGLLLNSRCKLYETAVEEVSIWGWPLQTAGLLTTSVSSKSFTVLSGRLTEWTNGKAVYLIRKSNSSWIQPKWSASAVQLDGNTWILEYKRSFMIENGSFLSAAYELLKFSIVRQLQKINQEFWLSSTLGNQFWGNAESFRVPT